MTQTHRTSIGVFSAELSPRSGIVYYPVFMFHREVFVMSCGLAFVWCHVCAVWRFVRSFVWSDVCAFVWFDVCAFVFVRFDV